MEIADNAYLNYGTWVHATNAGGGHESSARPILWRKAAAAPRLLYSVYLVEAHAWNTDGRVPDGGWTESDMYRWLNGFSAAESDSFYEGAFSPSEKNGLRANPDGDAGSRVTLPDVYNGYAGPSRFGVAQYRGSGNLEHWLRRPCDDTVGTGDAWGVGGAGDEGPGVVSQVLGVRPLIELDLSSFLFRSGNGTQATPYELYRGDSRMKPTSVILEGSELRLGFPVPIAAFGSLPGPADFTLVKNEQARRQRTASITGVDIPAGSSSELRLTLSEAALFQDGFSLSYALPRAADGALAGGALVAASGERIALAPFDDISVTNRTPPTTTDIVITPSAALSTPAYRRFDASLSISATRPAATVSLDDVTKAAGWDENLAITWYSASSLLEIRGVPTAIGRHTLLLDVIVDGMEISNVPVTVDILPQNSLAGIEATPSVVGPIELRTEADITYTVGSTVADASVELLSATRDSAWEQNGLHIEVDLAGRTFRVTGTPAQVGIFPVYLSARIDGSMAEYQYDVEVVYPAINPAPGDLRVTSDRVGPILTGRPTRFTYAVDSIIQDTEVALRSVTAGDNWDDTGLYLQPDLGNRRFTVWGVPTAAGNHTINVEALIDGVSLPVHVESFTVGAPPSAEDITFTPEMAGSFILPVDASIDGAAATGYPANIIVHPGSTQPTPPVVVDPTFMPQLPDAKAQRAYGATTEAASRSGPFVARHGATAAERWTASGFSFSADERAREILISGIPQQDGVYNLLADLTIATAHIKEEPLLVVQDQPDRGSTTGGGGSSGCAASALPFAATALAALAMITSRKGKRH